MARTFIIKKAINKVLESSQIKESAKKQIGDNQPPKKQIAVMIDNQSILLYSAKKNIANVIDEYSTL